MSKDAFSRTVAVVPKGRQNKEEVRFGFSEHAGRRFADIRVWSAMAADVKSATKSGISIAFESIPAMAQAMHQLEAEARAAGLIGGQG